MDNIIVTTKNDLENLIQLCVNKALTSFGVNSSSNEEDKILSVEEATIFLNLARQTLYGFTSKREIPFIKRGKKLYFKKSELNAWLLEGKKKSKGELLKELQ
ncbi:MAG: helix-turn-helix domain-containing protein [Bacteroidota bacterium]